MVQMQIVHSRNRKSTGIFLHDYLDEWNNDSSQPDVTYRNSLPKKIDIAFFWLITKFREYSCESVFLLNTCLHTPLHIE